MLTTAVSSSHIVEIRWENQQLQVDFKNGDTYQYEDVPIDVYEAMVEAPSVGKFHHKDVIPRFVGKKLEASSLHQGG